MKTALVVGGTGPTGPFIVNGLIDRGYEVTIFHGGFHEVAFKREVEHIHNDPHFRETFEAAIGKRTWDLVIFGYGRLQFCILWRIDVINAAGHNRYCAQAKACFMSGRINSTRQTRNNYKIGNRQRTRKRILYKKHVIVYL